MALQEVKRNLPTLLPEVRYSVRVRSYNHFNVYSEWSQALEFETLSEDPTETSGVRGEIIQVNEDYSVKLTDHTILANSNLGDVVITLPDARTSQRTIITVKRIDASPNVITVVSAGGGTIPGTATIDDQTEYLLDTVYEHASFQSDGIEWWTV